MNRRLAALAVAATTAVVLTGCGTRAIDLDTTAAQPVPGAGTLHRFCDGPTLIYVTITSGTDDEYEWFYPGGCALVDDDGDPKTTNAPTSPKRWVFNDSPPAYALPVGDSTDDGE